MSLRGLLQKTSVAIVHRDPGNDTESGTGEVTTLAYGDATTVYGRFQPGPPTQEQVNWGVSMDASAVLYLPAGTDIRPDVEESNGLGDKVTINSVAYRVVDVLDPAGEGKFLVCGLQRGA